METPPSSSPTRRPLRLLVAVAIGLAIGGGLLVQTMRSNRDHQERMAPQHLEAFARHQTDFRESDRDGDGSLDYAASLDALELGYMADDYNGYDYELRAGPNPEFEWSAEAVPTASRRQDLFPFRRHYFVDQSGVIRVELDRRATAESPVYDATRAP